MAHKAKPLAKVGVAKVLLKAPAAVSSAPTSPAAARNKKSLFSLDDATRTLNDHLSTKTLADAVSKDSVASALVCAYLSCDNEDDALSSPGGIAEEEHARAPAVDKQVVPITHSTSLVETLLSAVDHFSLSGSQCAEIRRIVAENLPHLEKIMTGSGCGPGAKITPPSVTVGAKAKARGGSGSAAASSASTAAGATQQLLLAAALSLILQRTFLRMTDFKTNLFPMVTPKCGSLSEVCDKIVQAERSEQHCLVCGLESLSATTLLCAKVAGIAAENIFRADDLFAELFLGGGGNRRSLEQVQKSLRSALASQPSGAGEGAGREDAEKAMDFGETAASLALDSLLAATANFAPKNRVAILCGHLSVAVVIRTLFKGIPLPTAGEALGAAHLVFFSSRLAGEQEKLTAPAGAPSQHEIVDNLAVIQATCGSEERLPSLQTPGLRGAPSLELRRAEQGKKPSNSAAVSTAPPPADLQDVLDPTTPFDFLLDFSALPTTAADTEAAAKILGLGIPQTTGSTSSSGEVDTSTTDPSLPNTAAVRQALTNARLLRGPSSVDDKGKPLRENLVNFKIVKYPADPKVSKTCLQLVGGAPNSHGTGLFHEFPCLIRPEVIEFEFTMQGKIEFANACLVLTEKKLEAGEVGTSTSSSSAPPRSAVPSLPDAVVGVQFFVAKGGLQLSECGHIVNIQNDGKVVNTKWCRVKLVLDWEKKQAIPFVDSQMKGKYAPSKQTVNLRDEKCRGFKYLYLYNTENVGTAWWSWIRLSSCGAGAGGADRSAILDQQQRMGSDARKAMEDNFRRKEMADSVAKDMQAGMKMGAISSTKGHGMNLAQEQQANLS